MTSHYDWETPEETRKANAIANRNELQRTQKQKSNIKKWINEKLEDMDFEQLKMMYDVSYDVEKYKTFFEVLRNLK
jgi:hypothetical protein